MQRKTNAALRLLKEGDPVQQLAAIDQLSQDVHLRLEARLLSYWAKSDLNSLLDYQLLFDNLWRHHQAILAARKRVGDKPAVFQSESLRPSASKSPLKLGAARGAADAAAAAFATLLAWHFGHFGDAALAWVYACTATASAYLFPRQQEALAAERDAGAAQTALAEQREADNARLAVLTTLSSMKGIQVGEEIKKHLKTADRTPRKHWRLRLRPFLIRPLRMAPFVLPAAALPWVSSETSPLARGHFWSNTTALALTGIATWIFFRKQLGRAEEYKRVTGEANRLALPEHARLLGDCVPPLTAAADQISAGVTSISREGEVVLEGLGSKTAAAVCGKFDEWGNVELKQDFFCTIREMNKHQLVEFCRQLVKKWDVLKPNERGRRLADRYVYQYEKDIHTYSSVDVWRNADEFLPPGFRFASIFPTGSVDLADPDMSEFCRVLNSLPCARKVDGAQLAIVLQIALVSGGWWPSNGPNRPKEVEINPKRMAQILPLINRLVELDKAVGYYRDSYVIKKDLRLEYVKEKSDQFRNIKARTKVRILCDSDAESAHPPILMRSDYLWGEQGRSKTVFENPALLLKLIKGSRFPGFDDLNLEIAERMRNNFPSDYLISEIVNSSDSEFMLTQLRGSTIEARLVHPKLGECVFHAKPKEKERSDSGDESDEAEKSSLWVLSLHSLEIKDNEPPPFRHVKINLPNVRTVTLQREFPVSWAGRIDTSRPRRRSCIPV